MNCQEWAQELPEHLQQGPGGAFAEHLGQCPQCESQWQALQGALQWHIEPPPDLAGRTYQRVQEHAARPTFWQKLDLALQRFGRIQPTARSLAMLSIISLVLLGKVLSPHLLRGRSQGDQVACQRNQRLLRRCLDDFAKQHRGQFPETLRELPLQALPECPAEGGYRYRRQGEHYQLNCPGHSP